MVRRTKEEALETRSRILEAAETIFFGRGVAHATLADIAAAAGVTRGAIYWHFSNKADLVCALLNSFSEPVEELSRYSEVEDDPLSVMRALLLRTFQQIATCSRTQRINQIFFYRCELTSELGDFRSNRQALSLHSSACIANIFVCAVKKGLLPADLDAHRAAISHRAFIEGIIRQWLLVPESFDIYQEAERLANISFEMVALSSALRR